MHDKKYISEIHTSFANMDRFQALIEKQRLTYYPEGRDFAGVQFEYKRNHRNSPKVRNLFQTTFKLI
jgi:hypothetical protein